MEAERGHVADGVVRRVQLPEVWQGGNPLQALQAAGGIGGLLFVGRSSFCRGLTGCGLCHSPACHVEREEGLAEARAEMAQGVEAGAQGEGEGLYVKGL